MSENINLKEIQRQVYLFYSEDGLADLAIGLVIIGFGIFLLVNLPALVGLLGLLPLLIWYLGKQILVFPRVGTINPSLDMNRRFRGFFINTCLLGIGVLVFFLVSGGSGAAFLSSYPLTLFGLVLALGISSLGVLLKAARFYLYGLLVFSAMAGGESLYGKVTAFDPFLVGVICAGGVILIAGSVLLTRFLNKYPLINRDN
jgi:hypothetical protein